MSLKNVKTKIVPVVDEDTLEVTLMELPISEEAKESNDKSENVDSMKTIMDGVVSDMISSPSTTTDHKAEIEVITQALPEGWTAEKLSDAFHNYKLAEQHFKAAMEEYKVNLLHLYDTDKSSDIVIPKNIVMGHLKTTYVKAGTRNTIDTKKLQEEEPELAKKYMKTTKVAPTIKTEWLDWSDSLV